MTNTEPGCGPDAKKARHSGCHHFGAGDGILVFTNANVITMSDAAPRVEAVAFTDDVISAVGDRATVEALIGDETQVIDLDGATVTPGLVDAHSHFFGEGTGAPAQP